MKTFRKLKLEHANTEKPEALDGSPCEIQWPFGEDDTFKTNLWKILSLPLIICMKFTIPDVRYRIVQDVSDYIQFEHLIEKTIFLKQLTTFTECLYIFILSFVMSIVWISVFSWLMVWWATRIGETWNIDPALMGLTVLAAGTGSF